MTDDRDGRPHPGRNSGPSEPEHTGEHTGFFTPDWDDEDDAPAVAKAAAPGGYSVPPPRPPDPDATMRAPFPQGPRPGMPPPGRPPMPPGAPYPPGAGMPPGGPRPPYGGPQQHPMDQPTDLIEMDTRYIREPELITHREPLPDEMVDEDGEEDELTEEELKALRRKKIWRRVRRTGYVLAGVAILAPIIAFIIVYQFVDVKTPEAVLSERNQVVTIYYADGTTELAKIVPQGGKHETVKHDDIPEHVRWAVVSSEDKSFYDNPGFDVLGVVRAAFSQLTGGTGGGSGISQQYVKVSSGEDDRTLTRKFVELVKSFKMNNQQDKKNILESYLNIIHFGRGVDGIEAASQAYFNKSVKDIDVAEAALLVAVIPSPNKWDPSLNLERATVAWNRVLDRMVENNKLPKAQRDTLQFPKFVDRNAAGAKGGEDTGPKRHIRQMVMDELDAAGMKNETIRKQGLKIYTTIDSRAQENAEKAVEKVMQAGQPENLRSALVAVDPKTGGVVAYYGGKDGIGTNFADRLEEPGSSFKPFVALAGLEENIGLNQTYDGTSPQTFPGDKRPKRNSENAQCPNCTVRESMKRSINTAFLNMAIQFGTQKVADAAHQAGIPDTIKGKKTLVGEKRGEKWAPPDINIAIGGGQTQVRPLDMAGAYATFANDGMRIAPHFVTKVTTADGSQVRYQAPTEATAAFDGSDVTRNANIARNVTESMIEVAQASNIPLEGKRPVASKTGTHQYSGPGEQLDLNAKAWMVGYTPQISTAVWVGGDKGNEAIKGKYDPKTGKLGKEHNVFGRTEPGWIWKEFMDAYLTGTDVKQFEKAEPIGKVDIPVSSTQQQATTTHQQASTTTVPPTTDERTTEPTTSSARPSSKSTTTTTKSCGLLPCPTTSATSTKPDGPGDGGRPGNGGGNGGGGQQKPPPNGHWAIEPDN